MRNLCLTLAYDGTNYVGWQVQPNGPSVQQAVQDAVASLTGETSTVIGSGRTDAGVHALGQVANFTTGSRIPTAQFRPALQHFLPRDIVVREVADVPPDFHATYWAKRKRYRYILHDGPVSVPFLQNLVCRPRGTLDATRMEEAACEILGTHDFRSFTSQAGPEQNCVRTVSEARVGRYPGWSLWSCGPVDQPQPSDAAEFVCLEIVADGFLYNMVRAIVGTLLKVGRGQWSAADVRRIVDSRDRSQAGPTAPADGLYLVSVDYPLERLGSAQTSGEGRR